MAVPTGFKYAALFKKHLSFNPDTPVIRYDIEELMQFFGDCLEMFKAEPTLLKVPIPVHVVGDIHGQYEDLHRIFGAVLSKSSSARFLFLGDLVDRGAASLQCLVAVLVRKMAHPNKYYLVRGNHEALSINVSYGFFDELKNRFEVQTARELMKKIGRMYAWIPLAAIINKKIFCVHGGIGPNISCLDDFDNVQRPLKSTSGNNFAQDILWSDPKADLMGTAPNTNRTTSIFYGPDEAERVCGVLGVDCIIRAHQVVQKGYDFPFHNKKVITLFSAPGYQTEPFTNDGAIAIVKNNEQTDRMEIKFQRFEPIQNAFGSTFKNMADDLTILESTDESMLKSEEDLDPKKAKTPEKPKEGVVCQDCQAKEAEKESKEFEKPKEEPKPRTRSPRSLRSQDSLNSSCSR
ncbi:hypothetical protein L596_012367 [Steinernema carpocapsae]|uniref:Serine/threonine-protein phosphatase n=1 Tax=Steinernema carpocapsae TaxID=34508 RepID=A0A4U5NXN7_STECR|nr:hypothetical protein L596_012367 [Steinernema carpocapsae]